MIESGSLTPGIVAEAFGLPAGTALRYERPDDRLRALLPSYGVLDSDIAIWRGAGSWMLPGSAQIWIVLADEPIGVRVRNRHYERLGSAVLYGGTSRAMPVTANGGVSVVVDIGPLGWARLFDAPAEDFHDRVTPLDQLWPQAWVAELVARAHASDREREVKAVLDGFFLERLPPAHRHEPLLAAINAMLLGADVRESGALAAALGIHPRTLLRLCARYFGYGPKMLMRRIRFLRTFSAMMLAGGVADPATAPPGYHDVPHFVREGNQFLGMTPRRFLATPSPYLLAALRARMLVFGTPIALLDRGPPRPLDQLTGIANG